MKCVALTDAVSVERPPRGPGRQEPPQPTPASLRERKFFIDHVLVRIWLTSLAPWEFQFPFPSSLTFTLLAPCQLRPPPAHALANAPTVRFESGGD